MTPHKIKHYPDHRLKLYKWMDDNGVSAATQDIVRWAHSIGFAPYSDGNSWINKLVFRIDGIFFVKNPVAVGHDILYRLGTGPNGKRISRKWADKWYRRGLVEFGYARFRAWVYYRALRLPAGALWAWNSYRQREKDGHSNVPEDIHPY